MVKPDNVKIKDCPFGCDGKIELTQEFQKFTAKGNIYEGKRWLYKCNKCNKGFTTTESDSISIENLKVRKL